MARALGGVLHNHSTDSNAVRASSDFERQICASRARAAGAAFCCTCTKVLTVGSGCRALLSPSLRQPLVAQPALPSTAVRHMLVENGDTGNHMCCTNSALQKCQRSSAGSAPLVSCLGRRTVASVHVQVGDTEPHCGVARVQTRGCECCTAQHVHCTTVRGRCKPETQSAYARRSGR